MLAQLTPPFSLRRSVCRAVLESPLAALNGAARLWLLRDSVIWVAKGGFRSVYAHISMSSDKEACRAAQTSPLSYAHTQLATDSQCDSSGTMTHPFALALILVMLLLTSLACTDNLIETCLIPDICWEDEAFLSVGSFVRSWCPGLMTSVPQAPLLLSGIRGILSV